MTNSQERLIYITLLAAQAVVIGLIERLIPAPFAFAPGAKLGLGNLITLIALFTLPGKDSLKVVLTRLALSTLLAGGFSSFLYAFSGSLLSFGGMFLAKQLGPRRVSLIGISTLGGILHNLGQLLTFAIIAKSYYALNYLPILALSGILSGFLVGLAGYFLLQQIRPLAVYYQKNCPEWQ